MAGGDGLNPRAAPARRPFALALAGVAAIVLVGHLLTLGWLARLAQPLTGLREMPEPMFTRVLEPADPEPPPASLLLPTPAPPPPPPPPQAVMVAAAPIAPPTVPPTTPPIVPPLPAPVASAPDVDTSPPPTPATTEAAATPEPLTVPEPAAARETTATTTADVAPAPTVPQPPLPGASAPGSTMASVAPAMPPALPASAATATVTATDPFASLWPVDTRVTYKLSGQFRGGPLYGSARVQWLRQGAQYQARVELSLLPFGGAAFTSQGTVTATGLQPQAFEEARGSRRRVTRFNEKEVVLHDGRSFPKPEGVQDMASQFLEIGHRLRTGQASTALGSTLSLPLVRPGAVDTWTYDIFAREMLPTPRLGELEVVRITPRPFTNARGTLASEIWFAPRLQYLPVRFRVSLSEEAWVDLVAETIEQR